MQLLQQDRLIDRINAELRPGLRPGESLLRVQVVERRPYEIGASFNNRRSPSVGGLRGEVYGALYNLTGFGDSLGARYGVTDGLDDVGAFIPFPSLPATRVLSSISIAAIRRGLRSRLMPLTSAVRPKPMG
ncbi:MAG: hypothetical protein M3255_10235 [Pseudomonadota bacterium]|nr:hypothetical protein [Pseudomonadota bacterium]